MFCGLGTEYEFMPFPGPSPAHTIAEAQVAEQNPPRQPMSYNLMLNAVHNRYHVTHHSENCDWYSETGGWKYRVGQDTINRIRSTLANYSYREVGTLELYYCPCLDSLRREENEGNKTGK